MLSVQEQAQKRAVDNVFNKLPKVFRTKDIRSEIADSVARSGGNYEEAALVSMIGVFTSIDRALKVSDRNRVETLSAYLKKI